MTTLRERAARALLGPQMRQLEQATQLLATAYQDGPWVLPPAELIRQLTEYDSQLVMDLVDQMQFDRIAGYWSEWEPQRQRAVQESQRLWVYSPLARWGVNLWTYYGVGESISITPQDEYYGEQDPRAAAAVWKEFWTADRNNPALEAPQIHDHSRRLLVDGNRWLACYISTQTGEVTVRRVRAGEIAEIVVDRDDDSVPVYYKRQWSASGSSRQEVGYYPDWRAFFGGQLDRAVLPDGARRMEKDRQDTAVVMLHVPFVQLDDGSLFGWPLLAPAAAPWFRGQKEFMENRLTVSRAVAAFVRRRVVKGGSRAVEAVRNALRSSLTTGSTWETNPPPVAGSDDIHNEAVRTEDLPLRTGAGDAKVDGEMFAWMACLGIGLFPHYAGMGDAYRLACYSEDTQVLTENGWKLWHEWQPGERIATYNQTTRALEYRPPTRLHVYSHQGPMVRIHSTAVDALVTPNHRMLVRRESDMTGPDPAAGYTVQQAGELKKRFVLPARAFLEDRPDIETFTLPGHVYYCGNHHSRKEVPAVELPMDDWLEFLGWWISEGGLHKSSGQVEVSQSVNSPHFGGLEGLFARLAANGLGFFQRVSHDGTYSTWGKTSKALYMWLEQNCGGEVFSKHLPAFALKLNQRQARILLDALWKGDGHLATDKQQYIGCYTSVSERLVDEVQILQMHLGDWGRTRLLHEESHGVYHRLPIYRTHRRTCDVGFCLRREKHVEWVDYNGIVWCFEAPPNKMFITRRNGQPLIAGNTASAMERPLEMQWTLYRTRLSGMFRDLVRIVLQAREKWGGAEYETYEAEVSTDRLVEDDLKQLTDALAVLYRDVVTPAVEAGRLPVEADQKLLTFSLQAVLQAMGANEPAVVINADMFEAPKPEPAAVAEMAEAELRALAEAVPSTRHPKANRDALEAYRGELQDVYAEWVDEAAAALEGVDEEDREEELAALLALLGARLKRAGRAGLYEAFVLGTGGEIPTADQLAALDAAIAHNDAYVDGKLLPALLARFQQEAGAEGFAWAAEVLAEALGGLGWRINLYKGGFWAAIGLGAGAWALRRDDPPTRRFLDPTADHCETCPPKAREYASWSEMVAQSGIPGDGSDQCNGNCLCGVEVYLDGAWVPVL